MIMFFVNDSCSLFFFFYVSSGRLTQCTFFRNRSKQLKMEGDDDSPTPSIEDSYTSISTNDMGGAGTDNVGEESMVTDVEEKKEEEYIDPRHHHHVNNKVDCGDLPVDDANMSSVVDSAATRQSHVENAVHHVHVGDDVVSDDQLPVNSKKRKGMFLERLDHAQKLFL
jgi:hypothetical protein